MYLIKVVVNPKIDRLLKSTDKVGLRSHIRWFRVIVIVPYEGRPQAGGHPLWDPYRTHIGHRGVGAAGLLPFNFRGLHVPFMPARAVFITHTHKRTESNFSLGDTFTV